MTDNRFTVFVLEDDEWYNRLLVHSLSLIPEVEVKSFHKAAELYLHLQERPALVSLDYRLPDGRGDEVLKKIKHFDERIEVIVVSEQEDVEIAVDLLKEGAFDYLVKNDNIRQKLLNAVSRLQEKQALQQKIDSLQKVVGYKYAFRNLLLGNSPALLPVFEYMEKALETGIVVSVNGETGTGKELVAKAIHYNSGRRDKPFVAVNMAAIPADLAESELFGHEKGAFTGAVALRKGKFEEAADGTLFLDEIAEMPAALQVKLLRVLQEKELTRIGGNQLIALQCRIIVATHRNLAQLVKDQQFREDLYYRLLGLPIQLPPLRERGEDILLLARHFADQFCLDNQMQPKTITDAAQQKLMQYQWPGNVRELKSVIELASVLAGGEYIDHNHVNLPGTDNPLGFTANEMTMKAYQFKILQEYLQKYNDDIKVVSQKLEISPATIYRMLKKQNDRDA